MLSPAPFAGSRASGPRATHSAFDRFERLIAASYLPLRADVLTTVRGKLAADSLHSDALDLEAAYNAAWHALYELLRSRPVRVDNLGGWLATVTYRRAIDELRSGPVRAGLGDEHAAVPREGTHEPDVDDKLADRQRYHQWLLSVRLRLSAREQRAVGLCVLHECSRKEASQIMGVDVKRLDKIMIAANKKLGESVAAITRGDWCVDQQSLIKAYALGLHDEGGERHALALEHVAACQGCASYVRSIRGLAVILPAPGLVTAVGGAFGGALSGLMNGGTGGAAASGGASTAAGAGGATLIGFGAKSAALCVSAVCAAGGTFVALSVGPASKSTSGATPRASSRGPSATRPAWAVGATASAVQAQARSSLKPRPRIPRDNGAPDPTSRAAQEIAELGIEPQATSGSSAGASRGASPMRPTATEFDIEGP